MEMQLLPWIKDDVAIEIIGKMIGEQVAQLYQLADDFKRDGYSHDSQELLSDPRYQQLMARIGDFKNEIDQIYDGDRLGEIHRKVDEEYVPHLNKRYAQIETQSGNVKFFDKSKGFGFVKPVDSDGSIFVNASDLNHRFGEDKPAKPESIKEANEHH